MGKTALVTGAASGIGYATAKLFLNNGYRVVGVDVVDDAQGKALFETFGEEFTYIRGDISDTKCREELVGASVEVLGRIWALINVAGVAPISRVDLLDMTEESYDRVMNINTKGTMFLSQAVARHMLQHADPSCTLNGAIVNVSSMSAYTSSISRGEYCVSKAGVSMLTKLFADRLSPANITVNEVRPGIIATKMTAAVTEKYDKLIEGGLLPLRRWGQPDDVAAAILSLANGSLGYTTGQSIDVDGGFHIARL